MEQAEAHLLIFTVECSNFPLRVSGQICSDDLPQCNRTFTLCYLLPPTISVRKKAHG
jgi:hypothetical protein